MSEISEPKKEELAESIYESGLLKFGEFTLKSGIVSPFYLDFRKAQSHPKTFRTIVDTYEQMISDDDDSTLIAGVPEAATPIAGALGYKTGRRLVQPRKVVKNHGTKSSVEGDFNEGDKLILLDDLITKGDSKLEAIEQIEKAGLVLEKFIVLVDRQQGGMETIRQAGYEIEAAFTISALINTLFAQKKLSKTQHETVLHFIKTT